MKLYVFPIAIIFAIIAALALAGGGLGLSVAGKKLDTVKTLDAALTVYDGLITGADTYVTECAEHVIPQSCVPTAQKVFAAAEQTKAAYLAVKPYGAHPPATLAASLIAAVNVLQAFFIIPANGAA